MPRCLKLNLKNTSGVRLFFIRLVIKRPLIMVEEQACAEEIPLKSG